MAKYKLHFVIPRLRSFIQKRMSTLRPPLKIEHSVLT